MENIWMKNWPEGISEDLQYRLGKQPLHVYLENNAKEAPDEIAYIYYGREITWAELNDQTNRFAHFLQTKGIEKGDRIGLFMQNCPQYIMAHYAVQKLGAIVSPLNPMFKETELEYLVNEMGAKGIVAAEELYPIVESVRAKVSSLELVVTVHYADYLPDTPTLPIPEELNKEKQEFEHAFDLQAIFQEYEPISQVNTVDVAEDVSLMVFTSGTTGRPKGAMLTFENALFKTATAVHANGSTQEDTWLAVMPLCHIAGMVMGVNIPVYSRTTCVLLTRFEPETVLSAIESYQITTWYSVAPMNAGLLRYPGIEKRNLRSLRKNLATSFGMPVTEELAHAWREVTGGCAMYEAAYGLSETHTCDTFMPADKVKFGSVGIPTYETELRILDVDTGKEVPIGQPGEIVLKNPGVFKGYWQNPEATKETLREGWVHTGDIGLVSEEGYLYFNGRIKEMIKCSGYSVFPEDVEVMLMEHPAIAQVAVIGVPDDVRGESVKAFVVRHPSAGEVKEEEIILWAKEKMAAYKYPREVEFRESLPATGTGKVLRRLLKEGGH